jgi:hypothetical protein
MNRNTKWSIEVEQKHSTMPSSWTRNKNVRQCTQTKQRIESLNNALKLNKE